MQLVNIHRAGVGVLPGAGGHPGGVVPAVALQPVHLAGILRRRLGVEGVRVRLVQLPAVRRGNYVFIAIVVVCQLHRGPPQALVVQAGHGVGGGVPAVKIPHYADRRGMGRPGAEGGLAVLLPVRPQKLPGVRVGALVEQIDRHFLRFGDPVHGFASSPLAKGITTRGERQPLSPHDYYNSPVQIRQANSIIICVILQ